MLNKHIVQGRLTATPELKMTQSGTPVCSFTIASEEDIKRPDGTRDTDFVDCVAWRGTAEIVSKYFTKGQMIIVEGRPKKRTYEDKNGVKHTITETRVENIQFTDGKRDTNQSTDAQNFVAPDNGAGDFVEVGNGEDLPF